MPVSYTHLDVYKRQPKDHLNVCGGPLDNWIGQDFANRAALPTEEAQSQSVTFAKGLEFLRLNQGKMCIRDRTSSAW